MSFFDDVVDIGKKAVSAIPIAGGIAGLPAGIGGVIAGGTLGEYARNQIQGGGPDVPQPPGVDPKIQAIKDAQTKQAKEFRTDLPNFERNQLAQFRTQRLRDLSQQNSSSKYDFMKRGLSGGGSDRAAQARNVAGSSYDIGAARKTINTSAEDMANQLEADALNSAVLLQRTRQGIQDTIFNQALEEYKNRQAGLNSIFSGLGTAGGLMLSRKT